MNKLKLTMLFLAVTFASVWMTIWGRPIIRFMDDKNEPK